MSYSYKNFVRIATEYINPNADAKEKLTIADIERRLKGWFCLQYNTTLNDPRLLDMTLEELFVQYFINKIKENPGIIEEELTDKNSYEAWLKQEMGEGYLTEAEMVEELEAEEQEYTKKVAEKFPDKITTDFSQFSKG